MDRPPWVCTLVTPSLDEDELTAGQQEQIFLLANSGLPHNEMWIHPAHCPSCRNAIAVVALCAAGEQLEVAATQVRGMLAVDLLDSFVPETEAPDEET